MHEVKELAPGLAIYDTDWDNVWTIVANHGYNTLTGEYTEANDTRKGRSGEGEIYNDKLKF